MYLLSLYDWIVCLEIVGAGSPRPAQHNESCNYERTVNLD